MSQETINRTLIRVAQRGRRVVRLKSGDPFVFGRGGEEALALAAAGVPFEVVPGVSSSVAAPALAGIPVTHRGLSSGFVVVSGHAESAWAPLVNGLAPRSATLVVLMGVHGRAALGARLLERGWPPETPVALIFSASTPQESQWFCTLRELAHGSALDAEIAEASEGAGTIVIGDVVRLSYSLAGALKTRPGQAERGEARAAGGWL